MSRKPREHNEWFRTVMPHRKSCPTCKAKLGTIYGSPNADGSVSWGDTFTGWPIFKPENVWSWGEYIAGRWRTITHFCRECFPRVVKTKLYDHAIDCGCAINLVGYGGQQLPAWLTLNQFPQSLANETTAMLAADHAANGGVVVVETDCDCDQLPEFDMDGSYFVGVCRKCAARQAADETAAMLAADHAANGGESC